MGHVLLLFWLLAYTAVSGAAAYRSVDESGAVHFSDRPSAGAEEIRLDPDRNVAEPVAVPIDPPVTEPDAAPAPAPAAEEPEPVRYRALTVSRPADGSTFGTDGGSLTVVYELDPPLQPGHAMVAWLDGKRRAGKGRKVSIPLERGRHRLQLGVADGAGKVVHRGATVEFEVRETRLRSRPPPTQLPTRPVPLPRR